MLSVPELNVVDIFAEIVQNFHLRSAFWISILRAPSRLEGALPIFAIHGDNKTKNRLDLRIFKKTVYFGDPTLL